MGRAAVVAVAALAVVLAGGAAAAWAVGGRPMPAADFVLPVAGVGSEVVELTPDAWAHPAGEEVWVQLQAHFTAINTGDYAAWQDTVVPQRAEALPEPEWREAYRTTRDGSVRLYRIDDLPNGDLLVRLRFVSTQDLDHAPAAVRAERICWRNSLPMSGSPPRIGETRDGSSVPEACP